MNEEWIIDGVNRALSEDRRDKLELERYGLRLGSCLSLTDLLSVTHSVANRWTYRFQRLRSPVIHLLSVCRVKLVNETRESVPFTPRSWSVSPVCLVISLSTHSSYSLVTHSTLDSHNLDYSFTIWAHFILAFYLLLIIINFI